MQLVLNQFTWCSGGGCLQGVTIIIAATYNTILLYANFRSKIIWKITCKQTSLSEHQSGFRKNHSCTTAILRSTEDIHKSIAGGKCVILVLFDFVNAYGSVDHNMLVRILESVGVSDKALDWYKSFVWTVATSGQAWKYIFGTWGYQKGIIQGENNSRMLFLLFINNLISYIKNTKVTTFRSILNVAFRQLMGGTEIINEELSMYRK